MTSCGSVRVRTIHAIGVSRTFNAVCGVRHLALRDEHRGPGIPIQAAVTAVGDDADDLRGCSVANSRMNAFADERADRSSDRRLSRTV